MGLFTTVWIVRPCRRCGVMRRTGVQFKTGDDYLQNYEEGAAIAPVEWVKLGDVLDGTSERYCGVCYRAFHADLAVASVEALAALVESGRLELRRKGTVEAVEPDAIRATARNRSAKIAAAPAEEEPRLYLISFGVPDHDVVWGGKPIKFLDDEWREFRDLERQAVDADMRARGWTAGGEQFEDWAVVVDDELRVFVGERL